MLEQSNTWVEEVLIRCSKYAPFGALLLYFRQYCMTVYDRDGAGPVPAWHHGRPHPALALLPEAHLHDVRHPP